MSVKGASVTFLSLKYVNGNSSASCSNLNYVMLVLLDEQEMGAKFPSELENWYFRCSVDTWL